MNYPQPPKPVLKKIYPWDQYNASLVMQQLYEQAQRTGFTGTLEDFKQRYGAYIEVADPQDIYDLIDNYTGPYHITPLLSIEQVLQTKNKVLNSNIIIDPIPENIAISKKSYNGSYRVTPLPLVDQVLRTNDRIMEDNVIIEQIPFHKISNDAGGYTFTIG